MSCERITPRNVQVDRSNHTSTPARETESGVGIREAKKAHARLVSDIRAGKYGEKVTPDKIWNARPTPG